jgi:hypothetical protein
MDPRRWLTELTDEEIAFLKRFVLASGSLKDLAADYRISYPTVRLRLDRLIQKIQIVDDPRIADGFERYARGLHAEGKLDLATLKVLLQKHRATLTASGESPSPGEPPPSPPEPHP